MVNLAGHFDLRQTSGKPEREMLAWPDYALYHRPVGAVVLLCVVTIKQEGGPALGGQQVQC